MTSLIRLFASPADSIPNTFTIPAKTDVLLNTVVISDLVTPTGYNIVSTISISGGDYSFDGVNWVSTSGTIIPGQSVYVRVTSSSSYLTKITVHLHNLLTLYFHTSFPNLSSITNLMSEIS